MQVIESPFWLTETALPPDLVHDQVPARVDVAVVGGGYTGLSAALQLARQGASTAVLEQHSIGWGASSRNGGQVLTGLKHGPHDLIRQFGRERARALFSASLRTIACVEALIAEEQIDCDYQRCGHIEAAAKPAHFGMLQAAQDVLAREFGHVTQILERSDQQSELGSGRYFGLLVDERSGSLQPAKFVFGLAQAARRAGAVLCEQTAVQQIGRSGTGFTLKTSRGVVNCQDVLIATNGYSGPAAPQLQRRVLPIGSYIIATAPLEPELALRLIARRRMVFDTRNFLNYFRLSAGNRLIFGGRAAFSPATPSTTRTSAAILAKEMLQTFPELVGTPVEYAWGGTLGFTMDLYPHAGRLDGMHYALGYAGHGVAMSTFLGQQMAQMILGGPYENPFEHMRFPKIPLYSGSPWFLPLVALWYGFLDLVS